ncbi:MAG TPA: stage III sporulation protein AB [Oscillospiraceae bacterium]|nr:stage III sporulation protein AB [Oscillospiraceae bacterium]HPF55626.1 stage III sporulation protein AB [Clostridiales bacterium]HPK34193.1 stage III sporulation protein AB [Oscillospiraceae bacterium]HPR74904.1 stage III sporulation protein AB [Oscillospiraceae bacterium]
MRLAAALLVCLASILIGFSQAARLKKRRAALEEFQRVLIEIKGLLKYENASTDAIFRKIEQLRLPYLGTFFTKWRIYSEKSDPAAALKKAAAELPDCLLKDDRALFQKLGAFLGRSDAQTQIELCTQLAEKCNAMLAEYERDHGNLTGLYQKLGILIGIGAAILIL